LLLPLLLPHLALLHVHPRLLLNSLSLGQGLLLQEQLLLLHHHHRCRWLLLLWFPLLL
jgi:hypothetical protein